MPKERRYYVTLTQLPALVDSQKIGAPAIFVLGDVVGSAHTNMKGVGYE